MANVKVPLQMVPVWVVNNGRNYLKFTLSRGHFYQKLKYLQTETTEQGPFLGETGACQMAQNGPMLFLMVNITISKLDVCMFYVNITSGNPKGIAIHLATMLGNLKANCIMQFACIF